MDDDTDTASLLTGRESMGTPQKSLYTLRNVLKIYTLALTANVAYQILIPTQTKLFESIVCWKYYQTHDQDSVVALSHGLSRLVRIPEQLCKIPPVQKEVSTLKGWLEFFDGIPSLVLAIPLGICADIFGRRKLFILNCSVLAAQQAWIALVFVYSDTISLRATWGAGFLNVFAGGKTVAEMLLVTIATDITPSDKLATLFFRVNAMSQIAKVLGPSLAAALMRINPWLAIILGLTLMVLFVITAITFPETLRTIPSSSSSSSSQPTPCTPAQTKLQSAVARTSAALHDLGTAWADWRLAFLVALYPFRMLADALADLLQRYVSNRYAWTLADATFLYSVQGLAAALVSFVLLPPATDAVRRRFRLTALQNYVVVARGSLALLAAAYLVEGLAPAVPVFVVGQLFEALGYGLPSALRALAGALAPQEDLARVFSVLAVAETLSNMIAYPVTNALFNVGLDKGGGVWLGLPYMVTATAVGVALVAMSLLRFERPEDSNEEDTAS